MDTECPGLSALPCLVVRMMAAFDLLGWPLPRVLVVFSVSATSRLAAYACPCKSVAYSDHQGRAISMQPGLSPITGVCHWHQVNSRATGRRRTLNGRGFVPAVCL